MEFYFPIRTTMSSLLKTRFYTFNKIGSIIALHSPKSLYLSIFIKILWFLEKHFRSSLRISKSTAKLYIFFLMVGTYTYLLGIFILQIHMFISCSIIDINNSSSDLNPRINIVHILQLRHSCLCEFAISSLATNE